MKWALLVVLSGAAVAGLVLYHAQRMRAQQEPEQAAVREIRAGTAAIAAEIARTEAARGRGLSGRPGLEQGEGMLFVFDTDDYWRMWMKDMRFPIDILFADASGEISMIYHTVSPDTYPQAFAPNRPARYALELPAGFAAANHIEEGSALDLSAL
ncbi:MAG TPA: DUF192 domain-containing protein [Candidatus Paceibacterota bacterium]|nr:DUF192 domain-containing protein [Candidatus Paceibacterota bacterium]